MSELHTIESLDRQPFKYMVATIGNLPTSFVDSMSYYELLAWLCQYLEKTVIPAIDNNAEALEEVQRYYIELKEYVDNYFDDLNVQEQINNKLDVMAEDGTLEHIINEELFADLTNKYEKAITTYATIASMIADEEITSGQTIYVKGETTEGDGFSGYYNVKTTGTPNGQYVIALDNGLYAHLQNELEDNFYPEITSTKSRLLDTDCFFVTVPFKDSSNNNIELHVKATSVSPNAHAIEDNTNVTINGPYIFDHYQGTVIGDGVVLNDEPLDIPASTLKLMGITEDRTFIMYSIDTPSQTMLDAGVKNAYIIAGQCVINGSIVQDFATHTTKDTDMYIGVKGDKTIIFMACNGRDSHNKGLTYQEASQILIDKGCINVYATDGGGSTSLNYRGVKLNHNVDDGGTTDRFIPYVLDIKKTITNKQTADIESGKGTLKKNIIDELRPLINNKEPKIIRSTYLVQAQSITPNNSSSTVIKNYGASAPISPLVSVNENGVFSINLDTAVTPYAIKITGWINVKNVTGISTSIYSYIYEDGQYQYNRYTRQTCTNTDYVCIPINYILNAGAAKHTYSLVVNAPNASSGTLEIENGVVCVEYLPNADKYLE